jgi:hypothetical protein
LQTAEEATAIAESSASSPSPKNLRKSGFLNRRPYVSLLIRENFRKRDR